MHDGKAIFDLIDKVFQDEHIPWTNCIALGSDNANVMVGKKNGVYGHMLTVHPSIYLSGCACHLIHHAAENAAHCLPFSIDQILVDVYYYLDKSSLRKSSLKAMQVLHELKDADMLKHVCTRWLSVSRCLNRVLENWDPLLQFIREESSSTSSKQADRLDRMKAFFKSPTNRLYCLFLKHAIAVFDKYNTELQCAEPKIHVLRRRLHSLLKELLVMFVKPSAMIYKGVLDVQFTVSSNIKAENDLLIGDEAKAFLSQKKDNHLRDKRIQEFHKNVKSFFSTACSYIKQKLPLSCELLKHAEVTDMQRQTESYQSSVQFFLKKFPCLIPEEERGKLESEFALYQVTDIRDIKKDRLDEAWAEMGQMKDENGVQMFQVLPKFMLRILTIPHSSAHCERVFSMVRKTHTAFRPNMSSQTLEAILINKSRSGNAGARSYTRKQLDSLKSCYVESLSKHV
ncbi:uncharacterized protein LOC106154078 [Lingula anatina]|uniref:Uncharacterized protein LOC106154078 n=1 Tax=Lingula anatina TaxID=7574 RepID=A0A1S3HCM1_LINAN|nr:uncharacterized protein LOC106154078 [Lingula anatina]|eukprot:XP_013383769.1 uncharacterized protein LOC106154078 [Lingula anatina]